ncbi:hypothetical protein [Uliginosibacterium aquaticum]|uniref:Uncharacterized protein n=1 Tax=Uliginosibacterium aquaticum TaxID=2731212 RepID=A0ABX2IF98_9RHOO|nr:hypothetical protein [Uliginosibacterium aquaticum]NSL54847.1 hypothetical protein [Uliginosibacterium aquaticum]
MSRTCRIRLASLPPPAELQGGLKALGYKLDLEGLDLASASGFQGCVLDGEDAGFSVSQEGDGLSLRWSGDPREHCAALMVAAALQNLSEAEISLGAGAPLDAVTLQSRVRELLDEM